MAGVDECLNRARGAGYRVLEHFVLPESAWWDDYYGPMEARLGMLRARYQGDPTATAALADHQQEIDCYRRWSRHYGYLFVIAARDGGG
jgi:hypothetical protein